MSAGRGVAALALAGTSWGTTGAAVAVLYRISDATPVTVSCWRLIGGLAVLALVAAVRRRHIRIVAGGARRAGWLLAAGTGMAVFQAAYFAAVARTGVAVATVVTLGAAPVLAAVAGRVLLAERIGRAGLLAVAGAVAGLTVLTTGGTTGTSGSVSGVALALASAAGYAVTTVAGRDLGRRGQADPYTLTVVSFAVAAVLLAPLALLAGPVPHTARPGELAVLSGYLVLVTTAMAYPLYFAGAGAVRAATAAVVTLTEPLCASILAVTVLGERLGAASVAGMVLLAGSIVVLARGEARRPAGPVPVGRQRR